MCMKNRSFRVYSLIIALMIMILLLPSKPVMAGAQQSQRIWGEDRYSTSAAISHEGWQSSKYAVLARGDDFADALCSVPLAVKYGGPILLTEPKKLNDEVLDELFRLGVSNVIIVGGTGAVSQAVENELKLAGIANVFRIFGKDRYETAVRIGENLGTNSRAFLVSGENFPDALSVSVIAGNLGMPILLTEKYTLPENVKKFMDDTGVISTYVIGGEGVISPGIEGILKKPVRLGGRDRYETNAVVLQEFAGRLDFSRVYVATGEGFADALPGAALAARFSSPVILINRAMTQGGEGIIRSQLLSTSRVTAFGGEGAVPGAIIDNLASYIGELPEEHVSSSDHTEASGLHIKVSWDDTGKDISQRIITAKAGEIKDILFYAWLDKDSARNAGGVRFVMKLDAVNGSSLDDISIIGGTNTLTAGVYYVGGDLPVFLDRRYTPFTARIKFDKAAQYRLAIYAVRD